MIRKMIPRLCLVLVGVTLGMQIPAHSTGMSNHPDISLILGFTVVRVELLHRQMIGEVSSVENSLARDIAFDVQELSIPEFRQNFDAEEMKRLDKLLTLLAVMQEKIDVGLWKSESKFLNLINAAASSNPEHAATLRCKDWSKPMWVGDECT